MENHDDFFEISEETVAAWLDGNLSPEEDMTFVERISSDFHLSDILDAYEDIESDFEHLIEDGFELPSEISFDFHLPDIGDTNDFDLAASNLDSYYDYMFPADTATENIQECDEYDCPQYDLRDASDDLSSDDFILF